MEVQESERVRNYYRLYEFNWPGEAADLRQVYPERHSFSSENPEFARHGMMESRSDDDSPILLTPGHRNAISFG